MKRLLVVSNRLPITIDSSGELPQVRESSGGLVSALKTVFERQSGAWIGWPGTGSTDFRHIAESRSSANMELIPVFLDEREHRDFYHGFSNEVIWPLFHDLQSRCNFDPCYWQAYQQVNRRFTEAVLKHAHPSDLVWVHDYHLALVGAMLRESGASLNVAYFQHIPFPSLDIFEKLPWGIQILESMLAFKVLGFQTARDLRNFIVCVQSLGVGRVRRWNDDVMIEHAKGASRARPYPISVDFTRLASEAASAPVEEKLASLHDEFQGRRIVLGVDRLDYTKGIPERLRSFALALELHPELRKSVSFVQVVVPSREAIPKYQDLKNEVEQRVSEINGRFSDGGWIPIHFLYRHLDKSELLAYYRRADVALVTPLKDGMNLVSKEYCAADVEEDGALVLSKFAGAASELSPQAIMVNPNHYQQVADAIRSALIMPVIERKKRMTSIRAQLRRYDLNYWLSSFLEDCGQTVNRNSHFSKWNDTNYAARTGS